MMGMRRGRSAHTVAAMPEDYGVAIEWRRCRSNGQGNASSADGVADANGASAAPSVDPSRSPSAERGAWEDRVRTLNTSLDPVNAPDRFSIDHVIPQVNEEMGGGIGCANL